MRNRLNLYQFVRATKDCEGLFKKGDVGRVLIPNDEHMEYAWVHFQNGNGLYVFEDAVEAFQATKEQINEYIDELERRHPAIINQSRCDDMLDVLRGCKVDCSIRYTSPNRY